MKRNTVVCVLHLLFLSGSIYSQDVTKVGTSSAAFLGVDIGARAVAKGGSFVAMADDITSIYWNPAGIARLEQGELALIHTEWIADTNFDWGAMSIPLGSLGAVGLSITSMSHADMEIRTVAEPEGTGEFFGANDLSLGLSYAFNLTDRFAIGFSGKFVRSEIFNESANSFAIDVGTLFVTQFNGLRIGATITNFGPKMKLDGRDLIILVDPAPDKFGSNDRIVSKLETDSFDLPLAFRAGVAMDLLNRENSRWTVAFEAFNPSDNSESVNLGTEYVLGDFAAVRFGYNSLFNDESEAGFAAGGGIRMGLVQSSALRLDYAYSDFGRLLNTHRFSIVLEF
jgi:long-subunit fatty acid transport protein